MSLNDLIFNGIRYSFKRFPFMRKAKEYMPKSESYVSIPPALVIRDSAGNVWTLGYQENGFRTGEFEYDVVRNGLPTGEFACRIELRGGKIHIYGADRRRTWSDRGKRFI